MVFEKEATWSYVGFANIEKDEDIHFESRYKCRVSIYKKTELGDVLEESFNDKSKVVSIKDTPCDVKIVVSSIAFINGKMPFSLTIKK